MSKKAKYKEPSEKDRKAFSEFLSEDEELILVAGYGRTYLRQRFIIQIMLPWGLFWIAGFAFGYFTQMIAPGFGLLIGMVVSFFVSYLQTLWIYHSHRYLLTTRRLIVKIGLLNVKLTSALYDKITHIEVDQDFIDRFFLHHGTIKIHTAGADKDELILHYVEGPIEFKNLLERLINKERGNYRQSGPVVTLEGELVD